ncbi:MAG: adenylate/guanylate cyclase domain-containing protein [Acidimicrobiia bacterium]
MQPTPTLDTRAVAEESDLGPFPNFLRPLVDRVARVKATVHIKLLVGFLTIAVLLLGLGVLSILVLNRVNSQVETLTTLNAQADNARQMIYGVTAQSHFRAMALVTESPTWNDKILVAKDKFVADLNEIRSDGFEANDTAMGELSTINSRFELASNDVTALYNTGDLDAALRLHIDSEHAISHDLEDTLNVFIADSADRVADQTNAFQSDRRFLTFAVATFSGLSLLGALLLGGTLSWSLIRPVRKVDRALGLIADGDFNQRVEVPNRDEFGNLTSNLNRTTEQLATLYQNLQDLNANLQETVERKVEELDRATELRRYVSPQLAESILAGDTQVELGSSRSYLTTFFSDIRGFTELSERMEPEEIVDELNEYLSEMTEIVFRHGGTLDKYLGDAIMVFFGDPVPQEDHAERAVRMALEMRDRIGQLTASWIQQYGESFAIGMGITTGWVTVGNIGSAVRSDYTVLGNQVNLASRLADRAEGGQILVSERTMVAAEDFAHGTVIDEVRLKGVNRPIKIYELSAGPPAQA